MATYEQTVALPRTRSERLVRMVSRTPLHIALLAIGVIWLVPTVGLAITSFRKSDNINSTGWWHAISQWDWTLHNYGAVIHGTGMGHAWVNSLIITVPASLVPLLKLFRDHGHLNNTYWGIWFAHTAFGLPLAIFLLRNFFITLPRDLIEAARMDGASNFAIFRRIVIPLSVPALASFGIFQFLWVWNDLLMALIFVSDPSRQPMTVQVTNLLSGYGQEYDLLSAASFLLMIVPLIVFFALQRYFVQGLLAGSVKT